MKTLTRLLTHPPIKHLTPSHHSSPPRVSTGELRRKSRAVAKDNYDAHVMPARDIAALYPTVRHTYPIVTYPVVTYP